MKLNWLRNIGMNLYSNFGFNSSVFQGKLGGLHRPLGLGVFLEDNEDLLGKSWFCWWMSTGIKFCTVIMRIQMIYIYIYPSLCVCLCMSVCNQLDIWVKTWRRKCCGHVHIGGNHLKWCESGFRPSSFLTNSLDDILPCGTPTWPLKMFNITTLQ